jgi:hypothetical protein
MGGLFVYILAQADYSKTNWYKRILLPLKAQARRKRVQLFESTSVGEIPKGEICAFVMGGSEQWMRECVQLLQARGCHPILLNEIDESRFFGHFSRVKSDYRGLMERISVGGRCAFYGMNPASASDVARRAAFLDLHPAGEIFENRGSLANCFNDFWQKHKICAFDSVICANDFAAVSLFSYLREHSAQDSTHITAQAQGSILSYFPTIQTLSIDPVSLSKAAFEIADCVRAHPEFVGVSVSVGFVFDLEDAPDKVENKNTVCEEVMYSDDEFYEDSQLSELLRIEHLLSCADMTDLKILHLLAVGCRDIAEEAFLSENGVKYRIKKMKQLCSVSEKKDITLLLEKYGINI